MLHRLTAESRRVIDLAGEESRRLGHEYIGTEHILLGLLVESSSAAAGSLARLGLSADAVRAEIANLVHRGPNAPDLTKSVSLTPRAKRAIQFAADEAANVNLDAAGPEHLLLGLIREPDGVAGVVMRNLGLNLDRVRAESLKVRYRQMQIVERAVRPVRAGAARKRHMREELLSHLTAICQEEQANSIDALAAMETAAKRFGDPLELRRELQASVSLADRIAYHIERWLGWRAPESVARMLTRNAIISFAIIALVVGVPIVAIAFRSSWDVRNQPGLRLLGAALGLCPAAQFAFGWCYFKARDAFWGAFGSRKSAFIASLWSLAAGLVIFAAGVTYVLIMEGRSARAADTIPFMAFAGTWSALLCPALARIRGATEIHDAMWGCLRLDAAE